MKGIKNHIKRFIKNEDGMEFIQVAVIVLAVIALAAAAYVLYQNVGNSIKGVDTSIPAAPAM